MKSPNPSSGPRTPSERGFGTDGNVAVRRPFLYLVLQADSPLAGGARFCLSGVEEVLLGGGPNRRAERGGDHGVKLLHLTVDDPFISNHHARIQRTPEGWVISEVKARNGVHINGARITGAVLIAEKDVITLGRSFFLLDYDASRDGSDFDARDITGGPAGLLTLMPSFAATITELRAVAPATTPITLVGETGTGKELVAEAIHKLSGRRGRYIPINCGGLARDLIESELFGHVKGAFSGATRSPPGYVEVANHGTLMLDEMPSAPPVLQAALLRVIQQQKVTPVGGRAARSVDVRFVAATQRPLEEGVGKDGFRDDLRARLEGLVFRLPPLRERMPDLGIFVAHALREQGMTQADGLTFTLDAALALFTYGWPLNMRELAMAVERARHLAMGPTIERRHLPKWAAIDRDERLKRDLVAELRVTRGNVTEAARRLKRNRTLVYRWLKELEIDPEAFR